MGFLSAILAIFQFVLCLFFGVHSYTDPTCTEPARCTICGIYKQYGYTPGHDFTNATCTEPKTCTVCGFTEGEPRGHLYYSDGICGRCGSIRVEDDLNNPDYKIYGLGETWIVDGQWEVTINSVTTHRLCNKYANEHYGYTNQQVVLVNYTYKNIGYNKDGSGLFLYPDTYYDEFLTKADDYLCNCGARKYADRIIAGASCNVVDAVVLENNSNEITIYFEHYDSNSVKQRATFLVPVDGNNNNNNNDNNDDNYIPSEANKAGIKKFKDHCKNYGTYSSGEYVVSDITYSSSFEPTLTFKMYYNPTSDTLRFEHIYNKNGTYTKLNLWISENTSAHKWEYEWKTSTSHMKGSGNVLKNTSLSGTYDQLENVMNTVELYEVNGKALTDRDKTAFLSSAATSIETLPFAIDGYFIANRWLTMDTSCFEIGA
ncbi:MAG: hypothetical protein J6R20_01565 [Clostridia bacterium]|nr:hypothetical protein [Clostridia bacterium]